MNTIRIHVNKQLDGYTFSIAPSIRDQIKVRFPNAHPANSIFVGYDTKSDFEIYIDRLENYIYPALLGLKDETDLQKLDEIVFIEAQTGRILHTLIPRDEKV